MPSARRNYKSILQELKFAKVGSVKNRKRNHLFSLCPYNQRQALSVFDTSNQLAINANNSVRENVKLYGKAIDAIMEYNNKVANSWTSFFTSAQRQ